MSDAPFVHCGTTDSVRDSAVGGGEEAYRVRATVGYCDRCQLSLTVMNGKLQTREGEFIRFTMGDSGPVATWHRTEDCDGGLYTFTSV